MRDIQIIDIRLTQPANIYGWLGEVRFIDKAAGYTGTKEGYHLWNWDKCIKITSPYKIVVARKLGDAITEVLCQE